MKQVFHVLIAIAIVIALAILVLVWHFQRASFLPCPTSGYASELCYYDAARNESYLYDTRTNLTCGEWVSAAVNLTKFELPQSYYACMSGTSLEEGPTYVGDLSSFYFLSGQFFACTGKVYRNGDLHSASNYGYIPNVSGHENFLTVYIYNASRNYTSIDDFANNLNESMRIVSLGGYAAC